MKTLVLLSIFIPIALASAGSMNQAYDLAIDANTLLDAYDENEVTADERYLNKRVSVGGIVDRVGKDDDGDPFVLLAPKPARFISGRRTSVSSQHIRCKFLRSTAAKVSSLRAGALIAVHGIVAGRPRHAIPHEIVLADCSL